MGNRRFVRPLNPTLKKPVSTRPQPLENDVERPMVENDFQKNKSVVEAVPNHPVAGLDATPDVVAEF